jgi:hypothetical protein
MRTKDSANCAGHIQPRLPRGRNLPLAITDVRVEVSKLLCKFGVSKEVADENGVVTDTVSVVPIKLLGVQTEINIPFHDNRHGDHDGPKDSPAVLPQGLHQGLSVLIVCRLLRLLEGVLSEFLLKVLVDHLLQVVDLHRSRRHDDNSSRGFKLRTKLLLSLNVKRGLVTVE